MARKLHCTAAFCTLLALTQAQSTTIIPYLVAGGGPTSVTELDSMPISDPPVTASVINAAPTGTTYYVLPVFDQSDIDGMGSSEYSAGYGQTLTVAPTACKFRRTAIPRRYVTRVLTQR